jgi:hypothetical protein
MTVLTDRRRGTLTESEAPGTGRHRRWARRAALGVAGLVLCWAYLRQARTLPLGVDGSAFLLQAWDMGHGNPLLHGWILSHVSFYTTELPQYLLIELVHGLNADAVHIAAAMTYTLLVLGAGAVAAGAVRGREGVVRALIAGGILLAPALGPGTVALLDNADHTGTQVPLLLVWLILDRGRRGWPAVAATGLLLTWAQIADPLVGYEGVLPLLVVCILRVYRRRATLRSQLPRYELALAAAAVGSAVLAALAIRVIGLLGGWQARSTPAVFATVSGLYRNLWTTAEAVLQLFGADFSGRPADARALVPLVHLAGFAMAAWAVAHALRRFRSMGLMVQVLAVTVVVLLVAFVTRDTPMLGYGDRDIAGVLVAGAVLAGRLLAAPVIRGRHLTTGAAVLACYAAILAHNAAQPPASVPQHRLASWLVAHDLRYGLSDFGDAGPVTVLSHHVVQLRHLDIRGDRFRPSQWQVCTTWYDAARHDARFLVLPARSAGIRASWHDAAVRAFGPPAELYRIPGFEVLVWHRNLLRAAVFR